MPNNDQTETLTLRVVRAGVTHDTRAGRAF